MSKNIEALIQDLANEPPRERLRSPAYFVVRLFAVLFLYGIGVQWFIGVRPDIGMQLARPLYVLEILVLLGITVSSVIAAVLEMYPDNYQRSLPLKLPYLLSTVLAAMILGQMFMPQDPRMAAPPPGAHAMECAICIACVALVPSALIFMLLRKGSSIHPARAGLFAVLAASGVGCITIRIAEDSDLMSHLIAWHYIPTLLFAAIGAFIGRWMLKW